MLTGAKTSLLRHAIVRYVQMCSDHVKKNNTNRWYKPPTVENCPKDSSDATLRPFSNVVILVS